MLCDDLIAGGAPGAGCDVSCLFPALRASQKFALTPEFASVADALAGDYTGLVKAFPHCRLPFRQTWLEFAHADRPQFLNAPTQAPRFQVRPKKIGFLLTSTRDDLSAWKAHLFWSTETGVSGPPLAIAFDMTSKFSAPTYRLTVDELRKSVSDSKVLERMESHPGWANASDTVRLAMLTHTMPIVSDYGVPIVKGLRPNQVNEFYEMIFDLARSDWAGEPAFLLAVIGLLNARNAVETETVDYTKLNRARIKRGKLPLYEHKLLKIARRQQRRVYGDDKSASDHAPMRGHFVMGHWKVRRTGIFFWHPHKRGDFTRGRIEKDYELT